MHAKCTYYISQLRQGNNSGRATVREGEDEEKEEEEEIPKKASFTLSDFFLPYCLTGGGEDEDGGG